MPAPPNNRIVPIVKRLVIAVFLLIPFSAKSADNPVVTALITADQAARKGSHTPDEWKEIGRKDAERRVQLLAVLHEGKVTSANDYYNAALIMQHGEKIDDIRMAHALATISSNLDPSLPSAKWLIAASWDRILMYMKRPQWYGTQFKRTPEGKLYLYEVDLDAVTDADRVALGVPTLEEARAIPLQMNGGK